LEGLPCEAITRPLREESKGDENDEAMTVSGCSPQFTPGITLKFLLQLKGLADLIELKLYYFILFVTLGMCICQDTKSLLGLSLGDEPSRGLWYKPENISIESSTCGPWGPVPYENHLQCRGEDLYERRRSPGPVSLDFIGTCHRFSCIFKVHKLPPGLTKCQPCSNKTTDVPCRIIDGSIDGSMLRVYQFGDQQRRRSMSNSNTEADEEASADKHSVRETKSLKCNAQYLTLLVSNTPLNYPKDLDQ
jgi:hypothetical protein